MPFYRYSLWDGSQQVFPVHEDDLMEQLSEELVASGDISKALTSMAQSGLQGKAGQRVPGIEDMLQRLRDMRELTLDRYDLEHVLDGIRRRLDDIVETERQGIDVRLAEARGRFPSGDTGERADAQGGHTVTPERPTRREMERLLQRLEEIANRSRELLSLPSEPGPAIQRLKEYEFMSDGARAKFDELLSSLWQRVLESSTPRPSRSVGAIAAQLASAKDILRQLNRLLEEHRREGESASRSHFERFIQKYGGLFGADSPANVEELVKHLRRQIGQMESLLRSLSSETRRQVEETLAASFDDQELDAELERFAANLELLQPSGSIEELAFRGSEPLALEEALGVISQIQRIEELEDQLQRSLQGNGLGGVDPKLTREVLGPEGYQELEQLMSMAEVLEDAGYVRRTGARYELTPKGVRRLGHRALQEIFSYIRKGRPGGHWSNVRGESGQLLEDTKEYRYGDSFNLHLQRSVMNAVQRNPGTPVRMRPEDFEVHQTEQTSDAATVLLLDLSLSMAMRGNFLAAKKVALALDNLIRTQFPRDSLHIVGFSTYAREVSPERLAYLTWDEFDPYTNIQQGLSLARRLLAKSPGSTGQIIMISDGEPTAHVESGQLYLQYPPSPRTIQETLKEVRRCTRQDVRINTFMLERNASVVEFVDQMTRINRGRVLYTNPDRLGEYILVDYLTSRRRQLV